MSRRAQNRCRPNAVWLLCGLSVGLVGLVLTAVVVVHYLLPFEKAVRTERERQVHLLVDTDYRALLEACRDLMARVDRGDLSPGNYYVHRNKYFPDPNVEATSFPKAILDLDPISVSIWKGEPVTVWMNGGFHAFGVIAFLPVPLGKSLAPDWQGDNVQLIPGLWYFDSELHEYPESRHRIDALIAKGKKNNGE